MEWTENSIEVGRGQGTHTKLESLLDISPRSCRTVLNAMWLPWAMAPAPCPILTRLVRRHGRHIPSFHFAASPACHGSSNYREQDSRLSVCTNKTASGIASGFLA